MSLKGYWYLFQIRKTNKQTHTQSNKTKPKQEQNTKYFDANRNTKDTHSKIKHQHTIEKKTYKQTFFVSFNLSIEITNHWTYSFVVINYPPELMLYVELKQYNIK